MRGPALIKIENVTYMSTRAAAELWGLTVRTVADYCNNNKIINKFKNGRLGWYIRTDEIKPLTQDEIRKILILTLQLKNNLSYEVDWCVFNNTPYSIENIYKQLYYRGYIQEFSVENDKKIPYEVVLTQKGMELSTSIKMKKNWDFTKIITQYLPVLINLAQLYFQLNPITE